MDRPVMTRVLDNREEGEGIKTIALDIKMKAEAGQFVMVWIPGVGEKPFSLSQIPRVEISYDIKGEFTRALSQVEEGERIGIRGPYGRGWRVGKGSVCAVAGGLGIAPILPLLGKRDVILFYGARSKRYIAFRDRIETERTQVVYTTDDGSFGKGGYVYDVFESSKEKEKCKQVLTCGPEIMMKKVVDLCLREGIPCQASLERRMKCGIGICGACAIDPKGLRVCKDGPVFDAEELKGTEFGIYSRDETGARVLRPGP